MDGCMRSCSRSYGGEGGDSEAGNEEEDDLREEETEKLEAKRKTNQFGSEIEREISF